MVNLYDLNPKLAKTKAKKVEKKTKETKETSKKRGRPKKAK